MASRNFTLPTPPALDINDAALGELWKKWKHSWTMYALAAKLKDEDEDVQVAHLLTLIGRDANDVYLTFTWATVDDAKKIALVLEKFDQYCSPRVNVPFERYKFRMRTQESGETFDRYVTALRQMASRCAFPAAAADDFLRDQIIFGITDARVRERLLRELDLKLDKTMDTCRAAETSQAQMKVVENTGKTPQVNKLEKKRRQRGKTSETTPRRGDSAGAPGGASASDKVLECKFCGYEHPFGRDKCPAYGEECNKCNGKNHFAKKCPSTGKKSVRAVTSQASDEEDAQTQDATEKKKVFSIASVSSVHQLRDEQLVTLKVKSGNFIRFQMDTGADCNVVPTHVYRNATGDITLRQVTPCNASLVAFGDNLIAVRGRVVMPVWRGTKKFYIEANIVDGRKVRSILGRRACIGMRLVQVMDCDALSKPDVPSDKVHSLGTGARSAPLTKSDVLRRFPGVFADGVGRLSGDYVIRLDADAAPVQHAPRRVAVALQKTLRAELDKMTADGIIKPVSTPTPWISSLVVVPKKSGKLRICIDPRDLNRAIRRENYPLPTIEDVATRLTGAKVFTILDVRSGFWHVRLSDASSPLTTFNTPFGRFRWLRMPFGICSAPEVFQRRMHEVIEGLHGIEVIADDFCVVGFGETLDQASADHDANLIAFLNRCAEKDLRLSAEKFQLRQREVRFIGHVASGEGLKIDPAKVKAVLEMPDPTDAAAVMRALGMVQYLAKFLPHLSDMTLPLRRLARVDAEWDWDTAAAAAWKAVKVAVTRAPVLRFYDLQKEVTLQCDASQSGLGAAMMQEGQPVAWASRALTDTECRYAQIEKELLAIVFACERFDPYIYGRDKVTVESDHKPLEVIMAKPLCGAPTRLQRMMLRLQRYNLAVSYKKGAAMFLADTLSRAYLPHDPLVSAAPHVAALESLDATVELPVSAARLRQMAAASVADETCQRLARVIRSGWPETKSAADPALGPYFDVRDELTVQGDLIFKGQQLVVPAALRKELMDVAHGGHMGMEASLRRMRECLFWPRMAADIRALVGTCDICLAHRPAQQKEPLMPHQFPARPWAKIGADLCEHRGRTLLVVVDYFSDFIEVAKLSRLNTSAVTRELSELFARYGAPDVIVSDNGPQFASAEFQEFCATWGVDAVTSSPRYARSNGKAESAVKIVKSLFEKCHDADRDEFVALCEQRNTPTEGLGSSPAQRFLGRRCRTLLPTTPTLLQPEFATDGDLRSKLARQEVTRQLHDRAARPLPPLVAGDAIRIRLPGDATWSAGLCLGQVAPRSYDVSVQGTVYRRNRSHILRTDENPLLQREERQEAPAHAPWERPPSSPRLHGPLPLVAADAQGQLRDPRVAPETPAPATTPAAAQPAAALRRSTRDRRPPEWLHDFDTKP